MEDMGTVLISLLLLLLFVAAITTCEPLTMAEARELRSFFSKSAVDQIEVIKQFLISKDNQTFKSKRQSEKDIFLTFDAFKMRFIVRLCPKPTSNPPLEKSIKVNVISGYKVSYSSIPRLSRYEGEVLDQNNSKAYGILRNNTFLGTIQTERDTYYLEPLRRYLNESDQRIFIYKASDLNTSEYSETRGQHHCTLVDMPDILETTNFTNNRTAQKNENISKRSIIDKSGTYCTIHMIADHSYFQATGKGSVAIVTEQFETMLGDAATTFSSTDFDFDGIPDGVTFYLVEISVFKSPSDKGFNRKRRYRNEADFLRAIRYDIYKGFRGRTIQPEKVCENAIFTHTSFGTVLGVTWGNPGICSTLGRNILMVTSFSRGRTRTTVQMGHTLSHELGHTFGSPHDPLDVPACADGGQFGDYLMSTYVLDSEQTRNKRIFSKCSRESIAARLINRPNCLLKEIRPVCGNQILDKGEECDCGDSKTCGKIDRCCTPSDLPNGCKFDRSKGKQCSPLYSPCCEANCKFTPASSKKRCAISTECLQGSTCNGKSPDCPTPIPTSNKYCLEKRKLCEKGTCKRSVCTLLGKRLCNCKGVTKSCQICCGRLNAPEDCAPFSPDSVHAKDFELPLYRLRGSKCQFSENSSGYCGDDHTCRQGEVTISTDVLNDSIYYFGKVFHDFWYLMLVTVSGLGIVGFLAGRYCTRKKSFVPKTIIKDVKKDAKIQYKLIEMQRLEVEENVKAAMARRSRSHAYSQEFVYHRLQELFPTVQPKIIKKTQRSSHTEARTVKALIEQGRPMKRYQFVKKHLHTEKHIGNEHLHTEKHIANGHLHTKKHITNEHLHTKKHIANKHLHPKKHIANEQLPKKPIANEHLHTKKHIANEHLHTKKHIANEKLPKKHIANETLHTKKHIANEPLHTKKHIANEHLHTKKHISNEHLHTKKHISNEHLHTKKHISNEHLHTKAHIVNKD